MSETGGLTCCFPGLLMVRLRFVTHDVGFFGRRVMLDAEIEELCDICCFRRARLAAPSIPLNTSFDVFEPDNWERRRRDWSPSNNPPVECWVERADAGNGQGSPVAPSVPQLVQNMTPSWRLNLCAIVRVPTVHPFLEFFSVGNPKKHGGYVFTHNMADVLSPDSNMCMAHDYNSA